MCYYFTTVYLRVVFYLFKDKRVITVIIAISLVCSVLAFALGAGFVYFNFGNRYAITFDQGKVSSDNIKKFNQVRGILEGTYYENVDENKLVEGAISGMADSLNDPYTVYFNKDQMKSFTEQTDGSYVGIGVSVTMDNSGLLTIVEPFEDSPAIKAGIKKDDKIIKVDDKDVTSLRDENMIIKMIKGPENTNVGITVFRPSENKSIDLKMQRKTIKIVNIKSEVLDNNVGYIKLIMFDADIANQFEQHLNALLAKGIKSLVIDVRDDPGGAYDQVLKIADRLLPKALIVYTEDKNKKKEEQWSNDTQLNMPIAVLINGNSASASEILAGSLKDNKKATLVGSKSFGKGLVQEVRQLSDGSGLKVTVARYYTPSGVCIQGKGISPDVAVELPDKYKQVPVSQVPREDDTQLKKALEILKSK
jgi:carboxyl-terminal processing protease